MMRFRPFSLRPDLRRGSHETFKVPVDRLITFLFDVPCVVSFLAVVFFFSGQKCLLFLALRASNPLARGAFRKPSENLKVSLGEIGPPGSSLRALRQSGSPSARDSFN
jgi:hypothetical protein